MYDKFRGTKVAEILTNHFDEIERALSRGIGHGEKSQGFVEKSLTFFEKGLGKFQQTLDYFFRTKTYE